MPEEKSKNEDYGKLFLSWSFPEYIRYKRGAGWYIVAGIIVLGMLVYAFLTANFLFVLFLIILAVIVILHLRRKPAKVRFKIFEDGLKVGAKFYPWQDINNFRLVYQPPAVKRLYIDLKGTILHDFSVPLKDQNPLKVREILNTYLEEDLTKQAETLIDRLGRWLKI